MDTIITLNDISKTFGKKTILDHITAQFSKGSITGIVGRNGSGKTVLFKCICGLLKIDEGEIIVQGQHIGDGLKVPDGVGSIIGNVGFLPSISGYKNLLYLASLSGKVDHYRIREVINIVGLDPESRMHVGNYSTGMRQRLGIAQAILDNPDLLILDEPMNGLDNEGVKNMRRLLQLLQGQGKTIILASHIQDDIDILCDSVYHMDAGILSRER